jgi:nucleotide-binding universal stress UspA family protein
MFRQIIVGLDGSLKANEAARVGFDLAKHYSGAVTLIHVTHLETPNMIFGAVSGYHTKDIEMNMEEIEKEGQKILDDALSISADLSFTSVKTHMPHRTAATEILRHAEQIDADLIITGRRGLNGIASLILGSTTQQINHLAKCATLSVV